MDERPMTREAQATGWTWGRRGQDVIKEWVGGSGYCIRVCVVVVGKGTLGAATCPFCDVGDVSESSH